MRTISIVLLIICFLAAVHATTIELQSNLFYSGFERTTMTLVKSQKVLNVIKDGLSHVAKTAFKYKMYACMWTVNPIVSTVFAVGSFLPNTLLSVPDQVLNLASSVVDPVFQPSELNPKSELDLNAFNIVTALSRDFAYTKLIEPILFYPVFISRDDFELLRKGEYEDSFVFQNPSNHQYSEYRAVFINNEMELDGNRLLGAATHICTQDTCTYKRGYTYVDAPLIFL